MRVITTLALVALFACSFQAVPTFEPSETRTYDKNFEKFDELLRKTKYLQTQDPSVSDNARQLEACFNELKQCTIAYCYAKDAPFAHIQEAITLINELGIQFQPKKPLQQEENTMLNRMGDAVLSLHQYFTPTQPATHFFQALAEDALNRCMIRKQVAVVERTPQTGNLDHTFSIWGPIPDYYLVLPPSADFSSEHRDEFLFALYRALGILAEEHNPRLFFNKVIPSVVSSMLLGAALATDTASKHSLQWLAVAGYCLYVIAVYEPYVKSLALEADIFSLKQLIQESRQDIALKHVVGGIEQPLRQENCVRSSALEQFLSEQGINVETEGYAVWQEHKKDFSPDEQKEKAQRQLDYALYILKKGAQEGILESCSIIHKRQALYAYNFLRELGHVLTASSIEEINRELVIDPANTSDKISSNQAA